MIGKKKKEALGNLWEKRNGVRCLFAIPSERGWQGNVGREWGPAD